VHTRLSTARSRLLPGRRWMTPCRGGRLTTAPPVGYRRPIVSTVTDVIAVTFSGGSLAISGWAALTAHRARRWQQQRDAARLETRVRLELLHSVSPARHWPLISGGPEPPTVYTVTLVVVNDGEAAEYVAVAFFQKATDTPGTGMGMRIFGDKGHEGNKAQEVRPRARLTVPIELEPENVEWMRRGFFAEVWLGSGTHILSVVDYLHETELGQLDR
jgi:hypothetical protein